MGGDDGKEKRQQGARAAPDMPLELVLQAKSASGVPLAHAMLRGKVGFVAKFLETLHTPVSLGCPNKLFNFSMLQFSYFCKIEVMKLTSQHCHQE